MLSKSPFTASVEALQAILNAVPNPVFVKDREHRFVLGNDAFCDLLGRSRDELINRTDAEYVPEEQRDVFWKIDNEVFTSGEAVDNEEVLTDGTGALRVIMTRKRLVHLPTKKGEEPFLIGVISDVTRFREAEARAQYLAEHDALTGLANRTQMSERLAAAIEAAERAGTKVALLLLDLDGFKAVNDQHGHLVGDELLRVIAKRLARLVRTVDTVSRFGGDEFCIVQSAVERSSAASGLAQRIIASVSRPVVIGSLRVSVSASVGIAFFPDDGSRPDVLLKRADTALYAAKKSGRRAYQRYQGETAAPDPRDWDIEAGLRQAIDGNQFSLVFQPLAAAADGKVRGFEALLRWNHPDRGLITPDIFIPVAESTGLIHQLGAWVLHKACVAAAGWSSGLQVSVNVSPSQLDSGDLPTVVASALEASGLAPSRLELEVTETALLDSSEKVVATFAKLKAMGIGLALDDFGAGWSSLATLQNFQFDRIKIDRAFITNIESDARSVAIVRAVLSLGHALNIPVTAEGVEAQGQLIALRQMGCSELQGYLLGRPDAEPVLPDTSLWRSFSEPA